MDFVTQFEFLIIPRFDILSWLIVKNCAQAFLAELLAKWEESWYIQEVGQVINDNANSRFSVYKDYCRNKPYQDKTLQRLR